MTEQEWLNCADWTLMISELQWNTSDRKMRLFACALCRLVWDRLSRAEYRQAVLNSEFRADGLIGSSQLTRAREAVIAIHNAPRDEPLDELTEKACLATILSSTPDVRYYPNRIVDSVLLVALPHLRSFVRRQVVALLRDVFGNPFQQVTADPSWLNSTVLAFATGIYEDRAFDRLPIFADALQDAGCDNADILDHCRSQGPHVRGCWVIDLLLGKS